MIDFSISPEFEGVLDWVREFVRERVEPMDAYFDYDHTLPYNRHDALSRSVLKPLQRIVKDKGLWGIHLPPHLGGPGITTVELALVNFVLGRTRWGPVTFGAQAPDSGNGEILANFGTPEQKRRWLEPLWAGDCYSCFSMTEVEGGSDPTQFVTSAVLEGDEWVINGEKWYSSNAHLADFLIVVCRTEPDAERVHDRFSTIIVPQGTPGLEIVRQVGLASDPYGAPGHPHLRFEDCRIPAEAILGPRGGGFKVAQARLGGGRIHHAMRAVGQAEKMLEMMTERAVSRVTKGKPLAHHQLVQMDVAECWMEIEQLKLLVLRTAWLLDQRRDEEARLWIGACKVRCSEVLRNVSRKAMHLMGSLGMSNMTPLKNEQLSAEILGMADGPSEVHQMQVGRAILKTGRQSPGRFPSFYLPTLKAQAAEKLGLPLRA
ncbi:acyl-CoA dehydrogenase family protein [uncultured Sphingomonas sp.]|uniref:acyl-CoA dehydrogenase family protein n=1 Tax=uncultured Sphingomonas sp. TaxID=158754 RepID=UPI0035CB0411